MSPDGKIYLATNGYSWPSQPPNEIIELNPNFNNSSIEDNYFENVKVLNNNGSYTITSSFCDYSMYDMTGRLLLEQTEKETLFLSPSDFPSGLYNLILKNGEDIKMIQLAF